MRTPFLSFAGFLLAACLVSSDAGASDMTADQLRTLEELLDRLGFAPGPVDGIVDADTRAAIGRYKDFAALSGDAEPSPALLEELTAVAQAVTSLRSEPAPEAAEPQSPSPFPYDLAMAPLAPLWVLREPPDLRLALPESERVSPAWPPAPDPSPPAPLLTLSEYLASEEQVDPAQVRLEAALAAYMADLRAGRISAQTLAREFNQAGRAEFEGGRYDAAIAHFDVAVHLDPQFAAAFHNRAVAHEFSGNRDLATADFERAYALGFGRLRKSNP